MKKQKQPNVNQLEDYLRILILDELKKPDAQQIIASMITEIDKTTAIRIKQHFLEIADFIKIKFSKEI